jgi:hypothetical protein
MLTFTYETSCGWAGLWEIYQWTRNHYLGLGVLAERFPKDKI